MLVLEECFRSESGLGFLRYDPFVVLPDLVVMEIRSTSENWLSSQDL